MTKEELLRGLTEKIDAQIPLRLDEEFGDLILTPTRVLFITVEKNSWIFRREWKRIQLMAWSLRSGIFGRKLILYFRIQTVLFHQPPKNLDFWHIFAGVETRLSSLDDGYWQYYWRRFLSFFEEDSADW